MTDFSGVIRGWGIFSIRQNDGTLKKVDGEVAQLLIGHIEIDYRGRFNYDDWFLSSRVTKFDEEKRAVSTLNSTYKLLGPGYRLCGTQ